MDNLIRISDMLVMDAKTRDHKKEYNIDDVILSHNGNISGFVISGKGILGIKHYVRLNDVDKLDNGCIIIKKTDKFVPKKIKNMSYASAELFNKKVFAQTGEFLGILSDFYIHMDKKQVMAVEVARSFFEDLFTGRTLIPGNIIANRTDAVIISELQLENSLHNTKGILNAIDDGLN